MRRWWKRHRDWFDAALQLFHDKLAGAAMTLFVINAALDRINEMKPAVTRTDALVFLLWVIVTVWIAALIVRLVWREYMN